ncbi:BTAD domain-containing putative transcriptional regulator [Plantactinospora solaniradicis]|uniref:BTAD domain-containing putative transcriptional regulator n=1 Tax=Plantactinospora solaniradicis TaxID=1723736 RepID=A0ABW1KQW2_9ACTN
MAKPRSAAFRQDTLLSASPTTTGEMFMNVSTGTARTFQGGLVRQRRRDLGLSQKELAGLTGLSERTVRDIEHSRVTLPRSASRNRISDVLGLNRSPEAQLNLPDIDVLGALRLTMRGRQVDLPGAMLRGLLGLFALRDNNVVQPEEIVDWLWGADPPKSARNLLHLYVSRLRQILEPQRPQRSRAGLIRSRNGGYELRLEPARIDVHVFRALAHRARAAARLGQVDEALDAYAAALHAWRGPVLADLGPRIRVHPAIVNITRARVAAAAEYAEIAVAAGRPRLVPDLLMDLLPQEPLNETLHAQTMTALAADGDPAMAVRLFHEIQVRLREELGISPGHQLQVALATALGAMRQA